MTSYGATGATGLVIITTKEKDHGEKFVVREHVFTGREHVAVTKPLGIVDTVEGARKLVPRGLTLIERTKVDKLELVEAWGSPIVVRYLQNRGRTL